MLTDPGGSSRSPDLLGALIRAVLLAAGLVVLLWLLHRLERVLLIGALAVILAIAINAPVELLERRGVPRGWGALLVLGSLLAIAAGLGWLIVPRVLHEASALAERLPGMVERFAEGISGAAGGSDEVERQVYQLVNWIGGIFAELWQFADTAIAALVMVIFLLALVAYLVVDPAPLLRGYLGALPPRLRPAAARAFARSSKMVVGWVYSNVILGGMKAIATFVFLTWIGVPGAILWAIIGFFAALLPRIGFYISAIPPTVVALGIEPVNALWVALFFWVLSEFLGNFVAPRVRGETMNLHPAYLLFMTLVMGWLFGLLGVLIASPIAGFLRAHFQELYVDRLPEDAEVDARVEAILRRDPDAVPA